MHPYLQVVILDELSISDDDLRKIKAGQTTETEETLAWLADNTAMTLAALSSSFLLDRATDNYVADGAVSETELDEMITRTGVAAVTLKNIMRSSKNIAAATSLDSVNQTRAGGVINPSIAPGASSNVPGARPRAMLYKDTWGGDHSKLARFVTQHLRNVDTRVQLIHQKCFKF